MGVRPNASTRAKMSTSATRAWSDPARREKQRIAMIAYWDDPLTYALRAPGIGEAMAARWADPTMRPRLMEAVRKAIATRWGKRQRARLERVERMRRHAEEGRANRLDKQEE